MKDTYLRAALAQVRAILRDQERGSDYDALYFGVQDLEIWIEDSIDDDHSHAVGAIGYPLRKRDVYGRAGRTPSRSKRMQKPKPKRKLSAWNKYVKANANKPRFKYKSGVKKGRLNLKKMGVAFRKTPAGKKSKR